MACIDRDGVVASSEPSFIRPKRVMLTDSFVKYKSVQLRRRYTLSLSSHGRMGHHHGIIQLPLEALRVGREIHAVDLYSDGLLSRRSADFKVHTHCQTARLAAIQRFRRVMPQLVTTLFVVAQVTRLEKYPQRCPRISLGDRLRGRRENKLHHMQ